MSDILVERDKLMKDLHSLVSGASGRVAALQKVAELLRSAGSYRWVGLYDVDRAAGIVKNVVWSGLGAPEFPTFLFSNGLTGAVISTRATVNVGNVASDSRYLTSFCTTRVTRPSKFRPMRVKSSGRSRQACAL